MSKVLQRVEVTLRSFYIFNSKFGQQEGEEHKKILYYHPSDIELNSKIKDVGLSEAMIQFTGTFVADDDCKALHTQKTTQLFYQPESGYWIVLALNVPKEIRSKDGVEVAEYRGCEVHDRIYRALLQQCYNMFRLCNGTFHSLCLGSGTTDENGQTRLQQRLATFFDRHLSTLKLPACDVLSFMRSIQYLPLEKTLFLRAHNFINMIRATFPVIAELVLLYDEHIVCGGNVEPADLYSLHQYLLGTVLENTALGRSSGSGSASSDIHRNGIFITDPSDEHRVSAPKIFLRITNMLKPYYLIIFRTLNSTLCLLISGEKERPSSDFYVELHSYMGPQLTTLANDIGEAINKMRSHTSGGRNTSALSSVNSVAAGALDADASAPKYVFINEQSLKHLTNIPLEWRHVAQTPQSIPPNILNLIADLKCAGDTELELNNAASALQEVQVKTTNDFWIVHRRWNWRQCYVIILNSKATLLDVTQEAKRIFEKEFTDDVFFDK